MPAIALSACILAASSHYGIPVATIEHVIDSGTKQSDGIGPMGIPQGWLPYLSRYGFDEQKVRTDDCSGVVAGTWVLAYSQRMQTVIGKTATDKKILQLAQPWMPAINWISAKAQIDPRLVVAVIYQESKFQPAAVSGANAVGLMQLMPATARSLGVNPRDPAQNLWGGIWYLANLMRAYHGNVGLALAAYNAGPGAVSRYGGIPPYRETQDYVPQVLHWYRSVSYAQN